MNGTQMKQTIRLSPTHRLLKILCRIDQRSCPMRHLTALSLVFCLLTGHAQRLTISDLLSVTNCHDTACIAAFAGPKGMCLMGGKEEDGWMWLPCDQVVGDSLLDRKHVVTLGFFGYPRSYYYQYHISTRDTVYATILTEELERLGFKSERLHPEGQVYRCGEYPHLEIERLERRHASIEPKRKSDPKGQYNKPLEELPEDLAVSHREQGFDSYDLIPELLYMFRAVVRK